MKKLLSALFILGSVTALASRPGNGNGGNGNGNGGNGNGNGGGGDSSCYESTSCKVEKEINLTVKVPKKLKITGDNIDFETWCGTRTVVKNGNYHLEGEPKAPVKVKFEAPTVSFKHSSGAASGFNASLALDASSKTLHPTLGTASGVVTATLNPGAPGTKPLTGFHSATAKLIAEYDGF